MRGCSREEITRRRRTAIGAPGGAEEEREALFQQTVAQRPVELFVAEDVAELRLALRARVAVESGVSKPAADAYSKATAHASFKTNRNYVYRGASRAKEGADQPRPEHMRQLPDRRKRAESPSRHT